MLDWLRQRKRSRRQPTASEAFQQLNEARCMYAGISDCSGRPGHADLGDSAVLVCKAHYGRLRRLDPRAAADLERQLTKAFAMSRVGDVAERALPPSHGEPVPWTAGRPRTR